jgi:hypothetical protein
MSQESRRALQHAVDDAYESRFGWQPEEIRSGLIARLGQLRFELTDAERLVGVGDQRGPKNPYSDEGQTALAVAGVEAGGAGVVLGYASCERRDC